MYDVIKIVNNTNITSNKIYLTTNINMYILYTIYYIYIYIHIYIYIYGIPYMLHYDYTVQHICCL